jgi:hypothetical protein
LFPLYDTITFLIASLSGRIVADAHFLAATVKAR